LERRWTVLSLQQHKILQLEGVVNSLQKELNEYKSGEIYKKRMNEERSRFLPKEPYKLELKGHRDSITCLAFHPIHSLIASSSDDSSIKIWDYESGHLEKSLRGHTNNVNFISFDTSGKLLGMSSIFTVSLTKNIRY
jgi:platelet-activating factor acetylhydrolase IB subunit alpha